MGMFKADQQWPENLKTLLESLVEEQRMQNAWMRGVIVRLVDLVEKGAKAVPTITAPPLWVPSPTYPRDTQITSNTPLPSGSYTYSGTGNDLGIPTASTSSSKPVPRGGTLAPVEPPAEPSALTPDDFEDLRNLISQRDSLFDSSAASDEFRSN